MLFKLGLILLLGLAHWSNGQENIGKNIAKGLTMCYNNTEYLTRDYRPPATVNMILELIRNIENGPSRKDARQLSAEILHKFRQDGIVKTDAEADGFTIPYRADGLQVDKNRVLLKYFIPNNTLENDVLTDKQNCALHFMLSNTVELKKRGDEDRVCHQMGRYQRRTRRQAHNPEVDIIETPKEVTRGGRGYDEVNPSECPIEGGVVYTKWGSIQLGTVLAGLASSLQDQKISVEEENERFEIDGNFATTIAGDIAEVAILYGPKKNIKVGAQGYWNNTAEPKYYFIDESQFYALTDAEIRADADGLIIAKNSKEWIGKQSLLKISQILDMYYSKRGVFSKKFRSCSRRENILELLTREANLLDTQSTGFSVMYNLNGGIATVSLPGIKNYTADAINKFIAYTKDLADLKCELDDDNIQRGSVDLTIVLDTSFEYRTISPMISYVLDNLDVNIFGSNVSVINGEDGRTIVESTHSLWDFYEQYNQTAHMLHPRGFKYANIFTKIEEIVKRKVNQDKEKNSVGGKSVVFLLMPNSAPSDQDKSYIRERLEGYKSRLSAFHIIVAGSASKDAYNGITFDSNYDIFNIKETSAGSELASMMNNVIKRVKQYPRKIANPKCGADWNQEISGNSLDQYIEPNTTNYYSIAPNYLFGEQEKTLKIRSHNPSTNLIVCFADVDCKSNTGEISYPLSTYCSDYTYIKDCPPFKFSVSVNETRITQCTDSLCRFPDNAKYTVTIDGFGCDSGSSVIFYSLSLIIIGLILNFTNM